MTVKVYGKTRGCVQCDATKRRLTKLAIPFEFIDVNEDAKAMEHILRLGYQQVPVVEYKGEHFSGYNPPKLQGLANARKDAA